MTDLTVKVNGEPGTFSLVANTPGPAESTGGGTVKSCIGRIVRIPVAVHGDTSDEKDGEVLVNF